MRVCVVGAGTAGLCSAKHALSNGMKPTIFEQSEYVGGTWNYTDEIGINKYGIEVHSSMYKELRTNLPKEVMGFPDFPIPEDKDSYISSEKVLNFLNLYTDNFSIRHHIKFLHYVVRIRPINNEWEVTFKDLCTGVTKNEYFQFVMICNGHYHTPSLPDIKCKDDFKGKQLHSHDFRCPQVCKDENVLIIGAGPSGVDLAHMISKVAKSVTLSHHRPEMLNSLINLNIIQKPDVIHLHETGAMFSDNTTGCFTMILFCTGFKYSFPFLSPDCGIYIENNCIKPLYKHCLNMKFPTMAFIGIPFNVCVTQMMDIQTRFVMEYFCKRKPTPSVREMEEDTEREMQKRWERGYQKQEAHKMGPMQEEYFSDLATTAGIDDVLPVIIKLHNASTERLSNDFGNFRNDVYKVLDDNTYIKLK